MEITVTVNGTERTVDVEPRRLLVHVLREEMGLTGTHIGCDTTSCGACTVLLDGTPVKSCTMFGVQAGGREVTTVEGMLTEGAIDAIQEGFKEEHGLQCGFCTPGMMLVAKALLDGTPVKSCTMFGVQAGGREVTTVEGMLTGGAIDAIQEGFKEEHGLQCGFCTPGMMLVAKTLLDDNPDPSDDDIRWAISGNICRCTGYMNIVKAIQWAARKNAGDGETAETEPAAETAVAG